MAKRQRNTLSVLCYLAEDEVRWYAHCLDLDILALGRDPRDVFEKLKVKLAHQYDHWLEIIDRGDIPAPVREAPKLYWDALRRAIPLPEAACELDRKFREIPSEKSRKLPKGAPTKPDTYENALLKESITA